MRVLLATSIVLLLGSGNLWGEQPPALPDDGSITITPATDATDQLELRQTIAQRMQAESISLDVKGMPLHEFVDTLSKQANVPISLDRYALQDQGLSRNAKVTIQAKNLSANGVLELALQKYGLTYVPKGDGIEITSREERDSILHLRSYSLAPLLQDGSGTVERWQEIITGNLSIDSWEVLGGPGTLQAFGNTLVVNQTEAVHAEIGSFLDLALKIKQFPNQNYPVPSLPLSSSDSVQNQKLAATKLEVEFKNTPLREAIQQLNESGPVIFQLDEQALNDVGLSSTLPVTLAKSQRSIPSILDKILSPHQLTWACTKQNNLVVITTLDSNCFSEEVRLYPVRDLVWHGLNVETMQQRRFLQDSTQWQADRWSNVAYLKSLRMANIPELPDFKQLDQLIHGAIRPSSWEVLGGPGSLQYVQEIDCVLIKQTPEIHHEIDRLLQQLRQQQTPETTQALRTQIEKANAEIVSVRYPLVWNSATSQLDEAGFNSITRLIRSGTGESLWQFPEASLNFAYRDLVVRQRRDVQQQILSMLIELDLLHPVPQTNPPEEMPPGQYLGGGGGGGFF